MKHRTSSLPAILLATLGSGVLLGVTGLGAFLVFFFGSLRDLDAGCQNHCAYVTSPMIMAWAICCIGLIFAVITFWAIYRAMRRNKDH